MYNQFLEVYGDDPTSDLEGHNSLQTPIFAPLPTPIPQPIPRPTPFPLLLRASGLYSWVSLTSPAPTPVGPPIIFPRVNRELRLDVDGTYPQMTVSGTESSVFFGTTHWIAKLAETESDTWEGDIYYKDGGTFPHTHVKVEVTRSFIASGQKAKLTLSGGSSDRVLIYKFKSRFFHAVEFEFDSTSDSSVTSSIETHAHPNRPASLASETLTIEKVFQRAGFQVTKSGGDSVVPISGAGADARWSDAEMHDAMQTYWSRFDNRPQWSLWTFFAALHEAGSSLGGIMFDDIGPNHRQGTAIFNNAFISVPPSGDTAPSAWIQRMRFWTACHEMGHSFNLAHSWQKQHPPDWGTPWIPLANEPEVRSFMNYPFRVAGGQAAFFANFEYRFSDSELVFLRHAPSRFVEMGNAEWFDHHGFEDQEGQKSAASELTLQVRVNRPQPLFEFLEPVVVELKLTNTSTEPQLVSDRILAEVDHMTVIIKRDKQSARQFLPYAKYCWQSKKKVLQPGESVYESLFISAGRNGWDIAEPGYYTIQVALHSHGNEMTVTSNPLRLRVAPPRSYEEEFLAQDFFSESVGRILAFDGSRVLSSGNDTLQQVVEQLADRRVKIHAQVALGCPLARQYKQLVMSNSTEKQIQVSAPNLAEAQAYLGSALASDMNLSAETLGHIDFKYYVDRFSDALVEQGDRQQAQDLQGALHKALTSRKVSDRVLRDIKQRQETL